MAVLTNPETFTEGMFDDMVAVVEKAGYEMYDYEGKAAMPSPCFFMDLAPEGAEAGRTYRQRWSTGQAKDFAPSKDGKQLVPVGTRDRLAASCNFAMLLRSMSEAGVPKEVVNELGGNGPAIEGFKLHLVKQPITRKVDGETRQDSVLVVEEVVAMPGDGKKGKGKGKGKGKKGKAKNEKDTTGEAEKLVKEILDENDGSVSYKKLPALVFSKTDDKDVMDVAFDPDFLNDDERPWSFDGETVSAE